MPKDATRISPDVASIEQRADNIKLNENRRQVVTIRMAAVFYINVPQLRAGSLESLALRQP